MPVVARTGDLGLALRSALPLFFASICTFIANDLDDQEKDAINHPERPLPSGHLSPTIAAIGYFASLTLALFAIRFGVGTNRISALYYILLITSISYHYIVEYIPSIKAIYVALVSILPIIIVAAHFPSENQLRVVAGALFLFMLGRELCKDLPDRRGDPVSRLHSTPPRRVAMFAFTLECSALILLAAVVRELLAALVLCTMSICLAAAYLLWFRWMRRDVALKIMQAILFFGLYFLL